MWIFHVDYKHNIGRKLIAWSFFNIFSFVLINQCSIKKRYNHCISEFSTICHSLGLHIFTESIKVNLRVGVHRLDPPHHQNFSVRGFLLLSRTVVERGVGLLEFLAAQGFHFLGLLVYKIYLVQKLEDVRVF